jgi:hypothetical protein
VSEFFQAAPVHEGGDGGGSAQPPAKKYACTRVQVPSGRNHCATFQLPRLVYCQSSRHRWHTLFLRAISLACQVIKDGTLCFLSVIKKIISLLPAYKWV